MAFDVLNGRFFGGALVRPTSINLRRRGRAEFTINPVTQMLELGVDYRRLDHPARPELHLLTELLAAMLRQFLRNRGEAGCDGWRSPFWTRARSRSLGIAGRRDSAGNETVANSEICSQEDGEAFVFFRHLIERGFRLPVILPESDDAVAARRRRNASHSLFICECECGMQRIRGIPSIDVMCGRCYKKSGQAFYFVSGDADDAAPA